MDPLDLMSIFSSQKSDRKWSGRADRTTWRPWQFSCCYAKQALSVDWPKAGTNVEQVELVLMSRTIRVVI